MQTNQSFYRDIKARDAFEDLGSVMTKVPDEYTVFVTDVRNSTRAIEDGRYKEVNMTGALCITQILNHPNYQNIPFVFGGDGVTFICQADEAPFFIDRLAAVRSFAADELNLALRVGHIDVSEVYRQGKELNVGKLRFGHGGSMAVFEGSGFDYAEEMIKAEGSKYLLSEDQAHSAPDFTGFSCPFAPIPSRQGRVMALILKSDSSRFSAKVAELFTVIGDERQHHPMDAEMMQLNKSSENVSLHSAFLSNKTGGVKRTVFKVVVRAFFALLGSRFFKKKNEDAINNVMIPASDYRKYDGSFKIVFQFDEAVHGRLLNWLDENENQGEFLYGYCLTDRSLMTCLFNGSKDDKEMHLIDAADGGYAMAAKMLKEKMARL